MFCSVRIHGALVGTYLPITFMIHVEQLSIWCMCVDISTYVDISKSCLKVKIQGHG